MTSLLIGAVLALLGAVAALVFALRGKGAAAEVKDLQGHVKALDADKAKLQADLKDATTRYEAIVASLKLEIQRLEDAEAKPVHPGDVRDRLQQLLSPPAGAP